MSRISCLQSVALILASLYLMSASPAAAQEFLVRIDDNRLTLKADRVAMKSILQEIKRQGNIEVKALIPPDDVVSADIQGIPLGDGLELLMRNYNHSLIFKETDGADAQVVSGLFICSRSGNLETPITWYESGRKATLSAFDTIPEYSVQPAAFDHHQRIPGESDPLRSMRALDPLARFEHDRPHFAESDQRPPHLPPPPHPDAN